MRATLIDGLSLISERLCNQFPSVHWPHRSRSKQISRGKTEMSNANKSFRGNAERQAGARVALSMLRIGLGALFINVFFENLNKGLYKASGYAGLINYYMEKGHAPQVLKSVMSFMVRNEF